MIDNRCLHPPTLTKAPSDAGAGGSGRHAGRHSVGVGRLIMAGMGGMGTRGAARRCAQVYVAFVCVRVV